MALTIDNCLIPQGSGTNQMYGGCCCSAVCQITNNGVLPVLISDFVAVFGGNFAIQSVVLTYQTVDVVAPFLVLPNTSFQMAVGYCAGDVGLTDTLTVEILVDDVDVTIFNFDFEAIDMSTTVDAVSMLVIYFNFWVCGLFSRVWIQRHSIGCRQWRHPGHCLQFPVRQSLVHQSPVWSLLGR